jgi:hypothetical protein
MPDRVSWIFYYGVQYCKLRVAWVDAENSSYGACIRLAWSGIGAATQTNSASTDSTAALNIFSTLHIETANTPSASYLQTAKGQKGLNISPGMGHRPNRSVSWSILHLLKKPSAPFVGSDD